MNKDIQEKILELELNPSAVSTVEMIKACQEEARPCTEFQNLLLQNHAAETMERIQLQTQAYAAEAMKKIQELETRNHAAAKQRWQEQALRRHGDLSAIFSKLGKNKNITDVTAAPLAVAEIKEKPITLIRADDFQEMRRLIAQDNGRKGNESYC